MAKKNPVFNRVKTGISGLDKLLKGGLPEKKIHVILGGVGTGKTNLGMEFIFKGATKFNEPGVFVNLEEEKKNLLGSAKSLGWDFESLEKENKVRIIPYIKSVIDDMESSFSSSLSMVVTQKSIQCLSISTLIELIKEAVNEIGAKRLVIDPFTAITLMSESGAMARMAGMVFFKNLRKLGVTTIITVEEETGYWEQLNFLADGLIKLDYIHTEGKSYRLLSIRKIRGSSFVEGHFNFYIQPKGIKVQSESLFEKV